MDRTTALAHASATALPRRALLRSPLAVAAVALGASAATAVPARAATAAVPTPRPLSVRGGDISFTLQMEEVSAACRVEGVTQPVEQVLRRCGASWVRLRVWTDPPAGCTDAGAALQLAQRARAVGLEVLLDLHLCDSWADPAKQPTPAAWAGQDLDQLSATVEEHVRSTLQRSADAGAPVDMVAVGNEITAGMLWPLGEIYPEGQPEQFEPFLRLLSAGIAGARAASEAPVMVHIDRGGDNEGARYIYDRVVGADFDVIGLSYYPFWHGSLADLEHDLHDLAAAYGKPLVVAETSYPWTKEDGDARGEPHHRPVAAARRGCAPADAGGAGVVPRGAAGGARGRARWARRRLPGLGAGLAARGRLAAGQREPERRPHPVRPRGARAARPDGAAGAVVRRPARSSRGCAGARAPGRPPAPAPAGRSPRSAR